MSSCSVYFMQPGIWNGNTTGLWIERLDPQMISDCGMINYLRITDAFLVEL